MALYAPLGFKDDISVEDGDDEVKDHAKTRSTFNAHNQLIYSLLGLTMVIFLGGIVVAVFHDDGGGSTHGPTVLFDGLQWPPSSPFTWHQPAPPKGPDTYAVGTPIKLSKEDKRPFMRDAQEYVLQREWDFKAPPKIVEYNWTISEATISPDGVERHMLLINGQFPGPTIEVRTGDTIRVNVLNNATNGTAFHWHGMFLEDRGWLDGVVGLTQCAIPPGRTFTYEFGTKGQWGTYWYHSHMSVQYLDGLFGPLIIHSPDEPASHLDYELDQVVMLHDHYYDLSAALLPQYLAPDNENNEPIPNTALINGRNVKNCNELDPRYKCDNSSTALTMINAKPDKKARLRFINVGGFAEFEVQIDEHPFPVIEIDGTSTNSTSFEKLKVNVAQRYSIILEKPSTSQSDNFWLRARMINHCFSDPEIKNLAREVRAVIHYSEQPKRPDTQLWDDAFALQCNDQNTSHIVPAVDEPPPAPRGGQYYLRSNFEIKEHRLSRGYFNQSSWQIPEAPVLWNIMNGTLGFMAPDGKDPTKGLIMAPEHTFDLLIDNFDDGNHPFHLHGYKFWVMDQGHGYFNQSKYPTLSTTNLIKRDTVTIEAYGWIMIRIFANNPGLWAFHCHNAWHGEAGLMMAFLIEEDDIKAWPKEELHDMFSLCY